MRPARITLAVATVAALLTVLAATGALDFAYRSPSLHVALGTAAAIVSALAAYLVYGRFRESCFPGYLLLATSLAIFAFANLAFSALPGALGAGTVFETWAPLAARTLAAVLFAGAVVAPEVRLVAPRRAALAALGGSAVALALIGASVWASVDALPVGIDPALAPTLPSALFEGHFALHAIQLVNAGLFAFAALGFVRRAERTGDELMTWLAVGAMLSAFARVHYFLFPSLYSEWVYTGDLFRIAFYAVLLVGLAREIERYWRDHAAVAVLEERRRMARDLHDGLAQELAFIAMQSKWLASEGDRVMSQISIAADRALDESRRAIAALTRPLDEPLAGVLADVAREVAGRVGLDLDLDLSHDVEVSPQTREALLRIVREAVTNAARHGRANVVRIELRGGQGVRLRIRDDGTGFEPSKTETTQAGGFGLVSMRERAEALGANLEVRSRPGAGTEIEVALRG